MCQCLEVKGAPIWGATCKCSHAVVSQTSETFKNNNILRHWICKQNGCSKEWDVKIGFESQDQLEGKT